MQPLNLNAPIRELVLDAFSRAVCFYKVCAANEGDTGKIAHANMRIQEYASGMLAINTLIDLDEDAFLTPEAADAVVRSLTNFMCDIDRTKEPLLAWYIGNTVIQCRDAESFSSDDDDAPPLASFH